MPANEILLSSAALHKKVYKLMGNRFEVTVMAGTEVEAVRHIDAAVAEISRIEGLLTTFNDDSETAFINRNAGIKPVAVSSEVFNLIKRSIRISAITQGAFDISYGSIDKKLWNFDQSMTSLPNAATAKKMVRLINYRNIIMDESSGTVFLKEKGMRIGFGGIGKGYAAERAKEILKQRGVQSGIVNASGDLTVWGHQPGGKEWTIGIADPESAHQPFS
ncbi:MAG: FAD:protein FMN transferase, partial [Chitinophagaceae bacterium]